MKKYSVCILFGGISPEHEVSLRSAESVLNNIDQEKYQVYPVGITREGQWIYFPGKDYSMLPAKTMGSRTSTTAVGRLAVLVAQPSSWEMRVLLRKM